MKREACNSGTIASIGYDPDNETLEVEFHSGGVYRYFGVPPQVHAELLHAESCGKYHHQHVKGRYHHQRV